MNNTTSIAIDGFDGMRIGYDFHFGKDRLL